MKISEIKIVSDSTFTLIYVAISFSNDKAIISSCLAILVADESVTTFSLSFALNIKKSAEILKQTHLIAIVLSVVLNVALVRPQLLNQNLLLSQL